MEITPTSSSPQETQMSLPTGFVLDGELKSIVWIELAYNCLVVEIQAMPATQVPPAAPDTVLAKGKYLSKLYLLMFYNHMKEIAEKNIE